MRMHFVEPSDMVINFTILKSDLLGGQIYDFNEIQELTKYDADIRENDTKSLIKWVLFSVIIILFILTPYVIYDSFNETPSTFITIGLSLAIIIVSLLLRWLNHKNKKRLTTAREKAQRQAIDTWQLNLINVAKEAVQDIPNGYTHLRMFYSENDALVIDLKHESGTFARLVYPWPRDELIQHQRTGIVADNTYANVHQKAYDWLNRYQPAELVLLYERHTRLDECNWRKLVPESQN